MNTAEHFPLLASLLASKRAPITAPWSTCEFKLAGDIYEVLLQQTLTLPRFRFDRLLEGQAVVLTIGGHRVSNRVLLGLVLTIVMAEYARREASEGRFWSVIARRFESAEFYTRLFTSVGQPTILCRDLLEQTARSFNLRHIYGQEGHKEWYSSIVLQFGFTRRGFERRLAEWLAGQQGTLAVRMLIEDPILRSPTFHKSWEALWNYRRGNRTAEQVRQVLGESSWVLPEWRDALIRVARERRELDETGSSADWEGEVDESEAFLSEPTLIWDAPAEPYLKAFLVHLADFNLQASDYTVQVGEFPIGRIMRQPDGSYYSEKNGELHLPFVAGCLRVDLVNPFGAIEVTQEIEVSDPCDEVTLYDATSGNRVIDGDGTRLVQNHRYVLLLSEDLEVSPAPVAEHRGTGTAFKAVALPSYTSGAVRVTLAGEPICEWSIVPRQAVDSSPVKLVWGNHFDDGRAGVAYARLLMPSGWTLRRARKDFKTLEFSEGANGALQSDAFPVTPDDHVRDVRIQLHLRFQGQPVRKSCRLSIPTKGVLWQRRGIRDYITFDPRKPLYTHSAQHDRFLFRLPVPKEIANPRDLAIHYREHVLIEGAFFHRRVCPTPTTIGQLHGFGQRLVILRNAFNSSETVLDVAGAVIDTGLISQLRRVEGEAPALELRQPIYPGSEHQVVIVGRDLSILIQLCDVVEGTQNHRVSLVPDPLLENHVAIGLFYRGVRLGSIWNHIEAKRLSESAGADAERALRVARVMRIFKFPLLSENYIWSTRNLALTHLPAFVTAWLDEQPVQLGPVTLKSPGLDEGAAYAFAELMRLDPLEVNADHVAALVETFGGKDPLADPTTALFRTAVELGRLSPLLAAEVAKKWLKAHGPYFPRRIGAHTVLPDLRARLLGGLNESQLVEQVSKATQTDEHFIQRHLQDRLIPNWKLNVRRLQHLLPFRVLLTHAFLGNL